jgi:hypothetical protein
MSGGVMLPPYVVAPLIQTLRAARSAALLRDKSGLAPSQTKHLSSSDWRPVVRDFISGLRDRLT